MINRLVSNGLLAATLLAFPSLAFPKSLPTFDEAMVAKRDVWGEAAIRQPNGPSYEFFEDILPPPRYVNADFRFYPIVLSAPNAKIKARLISDGRGVNVRGGSRAWNDIGTEVLFRVGPDEFLFGGEAARLQEPTLVDGYLPIAQIRYLHPTPVASEGNIPLNQQKTERTPEIYQLEAFASTDPAFAEHAVVFVKFSLSQGTNGVISVHVNPKGPVNFEDGKVVDDKGTVLAYFDSHWKWDRHMAHAKVGPKTFATIAIPTKALDASSSFKMDATTYDEQRATCIKTWKDILAQGMTVETPEPYVNDALRHLLIQNFELINGDSMHYSSANQYDKLYESEGSDAALAMMVWGYEKDMRRLMVPLFDFLRKGLEYHQAGFKLNDICRYYWQTRDPEVIKELRSRWETEAKRLDNNRTGPHGLFPKEQYCGDISSFVQSLNVNSKAWRSLRDLGTVLDELGEKDEAKHYLDVARDYRKTVLTAIEGSVDRKINPPFVPVALYTNELAHDPICDVRIGSYWNIIIGYTIGSGIFPPGSPEESWIPHYQEQHGGLCMGMLRAGGQENTSWNSPHKVNPLYGTRYTLDAMRRDDVDRSLVSFYGMLAQGFTRNTFISAEGASLKPLDDYGRLFYCPPNSAANGHFLSMLRYMLVQDFDLNDDGKPDTLRLCFDTPKRWLEDGKVIKVEKAPSAFGLVNIKMESHLAQHEVLAEVDLPQRNAPDKIFLRARVPDGHKVTSATVGNTKLKCDDKGTVDLTGLTGHQTVHFRVR